MRRMFQISITRTSHQLNGSQTQQQSNNTTTYHYSATVVDHNIHKPFDVVLEICKDLHYLLMVELKRCWVFRHGFICWVLSIHKEFSETKQEIKLHGFGLVKILPTIVARSNHNHKEQQCNILIQDTTDFKKLAFDKELLCWAILSPYILHKMQNEYVSSYLSTLGGAYSALGDYYEKHAKTAGMISKKQYILASTMNDPAQRLRCQLFYAFSLMQCNKMKAARKLIKYVHHQCRSLPVDTSLVETCCQAAWSKYKYLRSLERVT